MGEIKASDLLLEINNRLTALENIIKLNSAQQNIIIGTLNKILKMHNENKVKTIADTSLANDDGFVKIESLNDKKKRLMKIQSGGGGNIDLFPSENINENQSDYVSQEFADNQDAKNQTQYSVSKRSRTAIDAKLLENNDYSTLTAADGEAEHLIPVMQKLIGLDDTPVAYATITITDESGNAIKQAKSSKQGRWQLALPVGKYSSRIVSFDGKISMEQNFAVPPTDSIYELPQPPIRRN